MAHLREVNAALAEAKRAEENLSRTRAERLTELARVRTRIATDLHDDIGAHDNLLDRWATCRCTV